MNPHRRGHLPLPSLQSSPIRKPHPGRIWPPAFTLIELMVVIGIVSLLLVLLVPAFKSRKSGDNIANNAQTIAAAIRKARAYAMANNTYTWIGLYEEDASATVPTNHVPPYPGMGKVILATVASKDGTKIFDDDDTSAPLPPARITQVGKIIQLSNVHITDIGAPAGGNPESVAGRPSAYDGAFSHFARISSDDTNGDKTKFPFTVQGYTFYKIIRLTPRGEANINGTYSLRPVAEIGLRPSHGNVLDSASTNVVAIQFSGIAGNVEVFRQ